MIPAKFDYIKAESVEQAIGLLEQHGDGAKLVAGGHSLIPSMKLRLNRPDILVDIGGLSDLSNISVEGDRLVIGANCTHAQIARSEIVNQQLSVLAQTAEKIGDIQVRNRGTIGGSLAHADPASDYPATILATEARIVVKGPSGRREIAAVDFFDGMFSTQLQRGEMITEVNFPASADGVYLKFFQSASRFAVVGVAVVKDGSGVKIGITGVSDTPYRATAVESAYDGTSSAATKAVEGVDVMGDHFASEEYRSHLAVVFVKRALEQI